jgi:hypothetical protein
MFLSHPRHTTIVHTGGYIRSVGPACCVITQSAAQQHNTALSLAVLQQLVSMNTPGGLSLSSMLHMLPL